MKWVSLNRVWNEPGVFFGILTGWGLLSPPGTWARNIRVRRI
jgi:hypothetical protein